MTTVAVRFRIRGVVQGVGFRPFIYRIAVKSGLTRLPEGANWPGMIGIGLLAGIGFTMSLFIANLAFAEQALLDQAKIGVLAASVVASLAGLAFLSRALPQRQPAMAAAARP